MRRFGTVTAAIWLVASIGLVGCEDLFGGGSPSAGGGNGPTDGGPTDIQPSDLGDDGGDDGTDSAGVDTDPAPEDDTGGADTGDGFSCDGSVCGGFCCPADKECVDDQCLASCAGTRCGDQKRKCCVGDEMCIGDGCAEPKGDCERTDDCEKGQICQPSVGKCFSRDQVPVCEYRPPTGEFTPEMDCNWSPGPNDPKPNRDATEAAPTVGNMTDDNGDGQTDTRDIPDLVFLSDDHSGGCCANPSTIRIVDGRCNQDGSMTTLGSISQPASDSSAGIALGDLTGNGVPEIVSITMVGGRPGGTAAWTRTAPDGSDWKLLWHNKDYPKANAHTSSGATISLADLEADGIPDVVIGNVALNGDDGSLKWDGLQKTMGQGGVGNNAFLGPSSTVGDIDLDGKREVAAGNSLYDHDGTELWRYEFKSRNSSCGGSLTCDGFTGMADFDDDPEGEVVIVRLGIVYIVGHEGNLQWKRAILKDDCSNNESGPPTVADFDGDGEPEIGTAAADYYTVLDLECDPEQGSVPDKCRQRGVLWATPNKDCSSRATASSVFDFEGDGRAEMVYADEESFYILDGTNGEILHRDDRHRHNTRIELPLVADVDNDGNSEVVVGAPYGPNKGISIWGDKDDNWVRTRRIWNQHAYSVTNVEEDGTLPTEPNPNWTNSRLNNFRQNQQPAGVFDAPDLVAADIGVGDVSCVGERKAQFEVTVENEGALGVAPGVPVELIVDNGDTTEVVGRWTTGTRLLPGQQEVLTTEWTVPDDWLEDGFEVRARVDVDDAVNECDEDNNETSVQSDDEISLEAPGLEVAELTADGAMCRQNGKIAVDFTVENTGDDPAPEAVPLRVRALKGSQEYEIDTVETSGRLAPGGTESFSLQWKVETRLAGERFEVEVAVDPDQAILSCDETNRKVDETRCILGG